MKDPEVVEAFERVLRYELVASYGTPERAFRREETNDGWCYWCAGTESAYEKFLAGWSAAVIAQQDASKSKHTIIAGPGRVNSFGKITMGEDGWLVFEDFSIDCEGADDPRLAICNAAIKEIAKQKDWMLQKSQGCAANDAARKEQE